MRQAAPGGRWAGILALLLSVPAVAGERAGGDPATPSCADLASLVGPGETVFVTRAAGDVVRGRVRSLSPLTLENPRLMRRDGARPLGVASLQLSASDVARLEVVRKDPLWNGALLGLGAGAAVVFATDCNSPECDDLQAVAVPLTLALGAALGALLDALDTEREVVYDAETGGGGPSLSLAPLLDRRRRGVVVTLRF